MVSKYIYIIFYGVLVVIAIIGWFTSGNKTMAFGSIHKK